MKKVAEQHILPKCCECNHFGVISSLLKAATSAITHLAYLGYYLLPITKDYSKPQYYLSETIVLGWGVNFQVGRIIF